MNRCADCRHWTPTDGIPASVTRYGRCEVMYHPQDHATLADGRQAYLVGYGPICEGDRRLVQLRTGAEFGCTLWEGYDESV